VGVERDRKGMQRSRLCVALSLLLGTGALAVVRSTTLGITDDGAGFTLAGKPAFLQGVSYFGYGSGPDAAGLAQDLDAMQRCGTNWLRLWVTWQEWSLLTREGEVIAERAQRLTSLLGELDRRGLVADLTLNRESDATKAVLCSLHTGTTSTCGGLADQASHLRGVRALANLTLPFRNVYFDLANEHDVGDSRFVNHTEIRALRDAVKSVDVDRLVTASSRQISATEKLDFLSQHLDRCNYTSRVCILDPCFGAVV
jgi:hypothetical protein